MALWMYQAMNVLGQSIPPQPWEEGDAAPVTTAPPAPKPRMSFGDLQKSLRSQINDDPNDRHFRNMMLLILLGIVLVALLLHWRQRRKTGGPPDSARRLGFELSRAVKFPFGSKIMLWWVARSTRVPVAVLLISGEIFEASVEHWSRQPTFAVIREWGSRRLKRLRPMLFEA